MLTRREAPSTLLGRTARRTPAARPLILGLVLCGCAGAGSEVVGNDHGAATSAQASASSAAASATPAVDPTIGSAPASASASASASVADAKAVEPSLDLAEMQLGDALAPAAEQARAGKWAQVVRAIDKVWPSLEQAGQVDEMCAAQALKGRALSALGQDQKAAEPFAKVLAIYEEKTLKPLGDLSVPAHAARARIVVEAVSEATFFTPARRQRELSRNKPPAYRGNGSKQDVDRFHANEFRVWFHERRKAIDEVDRGYQKVLSIQPMPSPRWVVRAAERVGAMYESFLTDFSSVPVPKEWTGEGDLMGIPKRDIRKAFSDALAEAASPFVNSVKAAYKACVERAERFQVSLPEVNNCAKWLQDHE